MDQSNTDLNIESIGLNFELNQTEYDLDQIQKQRENLKRLNRSKSGE